MNAGSIDRKINGYLSVLSLAEKKAVLVLAKAFASSNRDKSDYRAQYAVAKTTKKNTKRKKREIVIPF